MSKQRRPVHPPAAQPAGDDNEQMRLIVMVGL